MGEEIQSDQEAEIQKMLKCKEKVNKENSPYETKGTNISPVPIALTSIQQKILRQNKKQEKSTTGGKIADYI